MTLRLHLLAATVDGAPGAPVGVPIRVTNAGASAATCRVSVVGLNPSGYDQPTTLTVPAGASVEHLVETVVPLGLGIGRHAAAIEIASDRPGDRSVLGSFSVSIGSVAQVALMAYPSTIRGRRRAKFRLEVANNEPAMVDLALTGEAPDVRVRFNAERVQVPPQGRVIVPAKVKGPRRASGEPTQHNVLITAHGQASSTSITTPYIQRALFAHRARMVVAAVTVVALWLGAIGVAALWWHDRSTKAADDDVVSSSDSNKDDVTDTWVLGNGITITGTDSNGDGILDTFTGTDGTTVKFVDTDNDGVPDTFQDAAGKTVADPSGGASTKAADRAAKEAAALDPANVNEAASGPTSAVIRGTIKADGDGTLSDIDLKLEPMPPDKPATGIKGFAGATQPSASKYWAARHGLTTDGTLNPVRQTQPVTPPSTHPGVDGVWQFQDVALRETYELTVSKPGFDQQQFVVTPPDDGSPVVLDIVLKAAIGAISGTVQVSSGTPKGVTITVSDGTSTFDTAADENGAWSVERLSTPGVYTVSASKRGFGTEVTQVTLIAGQQFDGADLSMVSGVASLDGQVTGPAGPLGGVKVTATNGETTVTTSTLTTGAVGRYDLPRLDFGTWSLLVEAPGYVSQTRQVENLRSSRTENFGMTRTTVRLTGMVTSDRTGAGIPNAGLILTTGDLKFKATTAVAPNAGSFAIDNLPPGNYTITVVHYQHVTSTQLVTLVAGVQPPPLNIVLERTDGLPAIGTGSLVVEVVDPAADTTEKRQIQNATVQLIRTQTGEALPPVTQEAFNFRIDKIPIGTYTLLVTAPRYNAAPARLVSIGLSEQRVVVDLQKLGQASGRVVDSVTKQPLTDYFVSLFRQPEDPGDAPVFTLASNSSGLWQTPADSLIPGTYRIEISDAASPSGYLVRNDQLLDAAVVGVGDARLMRFVLPEDNDEPITVNDIQADRYPTITGRVYVPTLSGATIGYNAVDRKDLSVAMSCGGGAPVAATLSDAAGVRGANPPLLDSFTITSQQIDSGNLVGDCALDVSAGSGLEARRIPLPGIDANDGVSLNDRRLHIALAPPAPKVGGSVFWLDGKRQVAIPNATIDATRVTHFDVTESGAANADPDAVPEPASTTSDSAGQWDLDGQVWGVADYRFAADNFAPGTITVRVDDSGATATSDGTTTNVTENNGRFEVELSKPNPRELLGSITIKSTDGSYDFDHVVITATSPASPDDPIVENSNPGPNEPAIQRGTPVGGVLPFKIVNALPGTWSVTIATKPDNHDIFGPQLVQDTVPPGSTPYPAPTDEFKGFNLSLVELATLRLTLQDANGADLAVTPKITLVPKPPGTATITGPIEVPDPTDPNVFVTRGIKVNPDKPDTVPLGYTLFVTVAGYDTTRATVAFDGDPLSGPATNLAIKGFDVSFEAGSTVGLTLKVPKLGSLEGSVGGVVDATGTPVPIPITTDNLTVTPVDIYGTPIDGVTFSVNIDANANTFDVSGDQGYYKIAVDHPQFTPRNPPSDGVPADPSLPPDPPASTVLGVFRIVNDKTNRPAEFVMDIIRGQLDVNAYQTLAGHELINGPVTYILTSHDPDKPGPDGTVTTGEIVTTPAPAIDQNGDPIYTIDLDALYPGAYTLEIRQYDDPSSPTKVEIAFPVITDITIYRAVNKQPSITVVNAPLPAIAPAVTGTIVAENSNHEPVALPDVGATYDVTSTYNESLAIEINGTTTIPDPTAANNTASIETKDAVSKGSVSYTFTDVPIGEHDVTLAIGPPDVFAAYTLDDDSQKMNVVALGPNAGPKFVLSVDNVALSVQLTAGDDFPGLTWTLTSPLGHTYPGTFDDATDVLTFGAVPPEIGPFTLALDDDLHKAGDFHFEVGPQADGDLTVPVSPEADMGRVKGAASQIDASGPTSLSGPATITLTRTDAPQLDSVVTIEPDTTQSTWTIDVPAGTYTITTTKEGYAAQTLTQIHVTAGVTLRDTDVEVSRFSSLTVTLDNGGTLASPTVSLRTAGGSLIPGTMSAPGGVPTATFADLEPGSYPIVVSAGSSYRTTDYPNADIGPGGTFSIGLTLHRFLDVTVSGPAQATVKVLDSGGVLKAQKTQTTPGTFTFSSNATTSPIPPTGDLILQIEGGTGFRTQRVPVSFALDTKVIKVVPVNVTVSGVLTNPTNQTLTGKKVAAGTITATYDDNNDGTVDGTLTGTVDDQGNFSIDLLGIGPNGENRTWTLAYKGKNVGTSSGTDKVTITQSTPISLTVPSIKVFPKPVAVTFTVVSDVTGAPVAGASVTFGPPASPPAPAPTTGADGKVTITVNENLADLGWSITASGFADKTGTAPDLPNGGTLDVPSITLNVDRSRTLTVRDSATGVGIDAATVTICPVAAAPADQTTCTSAATSLGTTSTAAAGPPVVVGGLLTFSSPATPGSYLITATKGTATAGTLFTVSATGVGTPDPLIEITIPAAPSETSTPSGSSPPGGSTP